jgi:hypothetical protein
VPQTYYETLGISELATNEEIEAAFKSKASEVHPDRVSPANPYLKKIAAEAFKNLSEAKAVLLDARKRQKYDAELAYSRGSSASSPPGTPSGAAAPNTAAPTPAATSHARRPRPLLWLVNLPTGLITVGIACGCLLLAGGIGLYRATLAPAPAQTVPAANSSETPSSSSPCKSERAANCMDGSTVPPPAGIPESSQTKRNARATPGSGKRNARSRLQGPNAGTSRTIVLWRATEPPDLSALSSSDRQAIESACSYAKLMEGTEIYNGCLAKELALRSRKESDKK